MRSYAYYPGCSVKGTARHYEESLLAVFKVLDIALDELPDWNCCGATFYMAVDEEMSFALSARNLALAERSERDLVTPCSACYLGLTKAQDYIRRYPSIRARVSEALNAAGLTYRGTVRVRHPLEVLINDVGLEEIRRHVTTPVAWLKIAPYYGCQIVRPYQEFDHRTYPETMDRLFEALGAQVVEYPLKTRCCGGSLTGTIEDVGLRLNHILLKEAHKRGANCIATVCPLCQFNLEAYQRKILKKHNGFKEIPIFYFTQALGLAFGLTEKELGLQRAIVPTEHLVGALRRAAPVAGQVAQA